MTAADYRIAHFRMMEQIADRLRDISAELLRHEYLYESFGSWLFNFERNGKIFRITLDGRDYLLGLEKAAVITDSGIKNSANWVKEWEDVAHKFVLRGSDNIADEVITIIQENT